MPQAQNQQSQSSSSLVAVRSQIAEAMICYLTQVTELLKKEKWEPYPLSSPPISQDVAPERNSKESIYRTLLEEFKEKKLPIEKLTIPLYFDLETTSIQVFTQQSAINNGGKAANDQLADSIRDQAIKLMVNTAFVAIPDLLDESKTLLKHWLKRYLRENELNRFEIYLKGSTLEIEGFTSKLKPTNLDFLYSKVYIATTSYQPRNRKWKIGIASLVAALLILIIFLFRMVGSSLSDQSKSNVRTSPPPSDQITIMLLDSGTETVASEIKRLVKEYLKNIGISNFTLEHLNEKDITETGVANLMRDHNADMVIKADFTNPPGAYHGTITIYRQKINVEGYTGLNRSITSQINLPSTVSLETKGKKLKDLEHWEKQLAILATIIALQDKRGFREESNQKYFRAAQKQLRDYDSLFDTPVDKRNAIGVFWKLNYAYMLGVIGEIEEALRQYKKIDNTSESDDPFIQRLKKISYANRAILSYFLSLSSEKANYLQQAEKHVDQYFDLETRVGEKEDAQVYILGAVISSNFRVKNRTKAKDYFKKATEKYKKVCPVFSFGFSICDEISDYVFLASQAEAIATYNETFYTEDDTKRFSKLRSETFIIMENSELGFEEMMATYHDLDRRSLYSLEEIERIKSNFLNWIGDAYYWRCDYASAIENYTQAIKLAERLHSQDLLAFYYDRGQAYYDLANLSKQKDDYMKAIPDLKKSLAVDKLAPFQLALSMAGIGRSDCESAKPLDGADEEVYDDRKNKFTPEVRAEIERLWGVKGQCNLH